MQNERCSIPRFARKSFGFEQCHSRSSGEESCIHFVTLTAKHGCFLFLFNPACNDLSFFLLFLTQTISRQVSPSLNGKKHSESFLLGSVSSVGCRNDNSECGSLRLPVIKDRKSHISAYVLTITSS